MKFAGADIRIVNMTKNMVVALVREFIDSNQLHIDNEELSPTIAHITASNATDSRLKLWWKGTPQRIDWKIVELGEKETRIETRFGVHKYFLIWFWCIATLLLFLFHIWSELTINDPFLRIIEEVAKISLPRISYTNMTNISVVILLTAGFFFAKDRFNVEPFLNSFKKLLIKNNLNYSEEIFQQNCRDPQYFTKLWFFILAMSIFVVRNLNHFLSLPIPAPFIITSSIAIFLLLIFLAILYVSASDPGLMARFRFVLAGIFVTLPLFLFYSSPYVSGSLGNPRITSIVIGNLQMLKRNSALLEAGTNYFVMFFFVNFTLASLAIAFFVRVPKIVADVRGWRNEFFLGCWTPLHGEIVGIRGFRRNIFYLMVLPFWVITSLGLYILSYVTLSIMEFTIINQQVFFRTKIGELFSGTMIAGFKFFLAPFLGTSLSVWSARVLLFAYCAPLVFLLYKVFEKMGRSCIGNVREIGRVLENSEIDTFGIRNIVMELSQYYNIKRPDVVMLPSKKPILSAKYIGFPYFRSYVLLSEGCLNLKKEELLGLLAHEIYHIKQHSFKWYALNLISDCTLFGSGFLAVTINSYQYELDADRYATEWIKERGEVSDYINGLRIMDLAHAGFGRGKADLKLSSSHQKNADKDKEIKEPFLRRMKRNIDSVFEFYFGDEILSYIHPPLEERIERIKATGEGFAENKE